MKELLGQIQNTSLSGIIKYAGGISDAPEYDGTITIEGEPIVPKTVPEYDGTITIV